MTETEEILNDWKAVYAEQYPHRDPERMQYSDAMLAGFTMLRRELRSSRGERLRFRIKARFQRYNGESA